MGGAVEGEEGWTVKAAGYVKYFFFRAACWMVGWLPVGFSHGVGVVMGEIAYRFLRRKRDVVYENMRRVIPEGSPPQWRNLARKSFYNYARYWVDFLRCYHLTTDEVYNHLVVPHGTEWFDVCLERGRGVILALPHYGSWDVQGGWVGHNYPNLWAVAEVLKPRAMFEFHTELRRRMNIGIIPLGEDTVNRVVEILAANGMVCLLSDRVVAGSGVEVEFFGERVQMPVGPALLGIKMGASILPCLTIRQEGRYHGYVGPPLELEISGDTRRDVQVNTQKLAWVFEDFIRKDPTQWHMFQPIFKAPGRE